MASRSHAAYWGQVARARMKAERREQAKTHMHVFSKNSADLCPEIFSGACALHKHVWKDDRILEFPGTEATRDSASVPGGSPSLGGTCTLSPLPSPVSVTPSFFVGRSPFSSSSASSTISRSRLTSLSSSSLPSPPSSSESPSASPCEPRSEPPSESPSESRSTPLCESLSSFSVSPAVSSVSSICGEEAPLLSRPPSRPLRLANQLQTSPSSHRRLSADCKLSGRREGTREGDAGVEETVSGASAASRLPPSLSCDCEDHLSETHTLAAGLGGVLRDLYRLRASIFARASCAVRHRCGSGPSQREAIFCCLLHHSQELTSLLLRLRSELLKSRDFFAASPAASCSPLDPPHSRTLSSDAPPLDSYQPHPLVSSSSSSSSSSSLSSLSPSSSSLSSVSSSLAPSSCFPSSFESFESFSEASCRSPASLDAPEPQGTRGHEESANSPFRPRQLWSFLGRVGSILTTLGKSLPVPPSVDLDKHRVAPTEFEQHLRRLLSSISHVLPTVERASQDGTQRTDRCSEKKANSLGSRETPQLSSSRAPSRLQQRATSRAEEEGPSPHAGRAEPRSSGVSKIDLSDCPLTQDLQKLLHAYALAATAALTTAATLPVRDAADEWIIATLHSTAWCVRLFPCFPPSSVSPADGAPFACSGVWPGRSVSRSSLPLFVASSLSSAVQSFASTAQESLPALTAAVQTRIHRLREAALLDLVWSVTSLKDVLCMHRGAAVASESQAGFAALSGETFVSWESERRFPGQPAEAMATPGFRGGASPSLEKETSPEPAFSPDVFMEAIAERTADVSEGRSRALPVALLRAACVFSSFPPSLFVRFSRMILNLGGDAHPSEPALPERTPSFSSSLASTLPVSSSCSPSSSSMSASSYSSAYASPVSSSSPSVCVSSASPLPSGATPLPGGRVSPARHADVPETFLEASSPAALSALLWAYARFLTSSSFTRETSESPYASSPSLSCLNSLPAHSRLHRAAFYAVLGHALESFRRQPWWACVAGVSPLLPASRFRRQRRGQESETGESDKARTGKEAWENRSICTSCWAASRVLEVTPVSERANRLLTLAFLQESLRFCLRPASAGVSSASAAGVPGASFSLLGGPFLDLMNLLEATYRCRVLSLPLLDFVVAGLARKEAASTSVRTHPEPNYFFSLGEENGKPKRDGCTSREVWAGVALFVMLARHATFASEQLIEAAGRQGFRPKRMQSNSSRGLAVTEATAGREPVSRSASREASWAGCRAAPSTAGEIDAKTSKEHTRSGGVSLLAGHADAAALSGSRPAEALCLQGKAAFQGTPDDAETAERALAKLAEGRGVLVRTLSRHFHEVRDSEVSNVLWALVTALRSGEAKDGFAFPKGNETSRRVQAFDREDGRGPCTAREGDETPGAHRVNSLACRPGALGLLPAKSDEGKLLEQILARMHAPTFACPPEHISRVAWALTRPELVDFVEKEGVPQPIVSEVLDKLLARVLASDPAGARRMRERERKTGTKRAAATGRLAETPNEARVPGPLLSLLGIERLCSILVSYPSFQRANENVKNRFVGAAFDELFDLFSAIEACPGIAKTPPPTSAMSRQISPQGLWLQGRVLGPSKSPGALSRLIDEALKMETLAGVVWALNVLNRRHSLLVALVTDHVTSRLLQHSRCQWEDAAGEETGSGNVNEETGSTPIRMAEAEENATSLAKAGGRNISAPSGRRSGGVSASLLQGDASGRDSGTLQRQGGEPLGGERETVAAGEDGANYADNFASLPAGLSILSSPSSSPPTRARFPRLLMTFLTACSKLRCDLPPLFFDACSRYMAGLTAFVVKQVSLHADVSLGSLPTGASASSSSLPVQGACCDSEKREQLLPPSAREAIQSKDACTALKAQEIMAKAGWPLWTCANLLSACTACGCRDSRFLQPFTRLLSLALLGKADLCAETERPQGGAPGNAQRRAGHVTRPLGVDGACLPPSGVSVASVGVSETSLMPVSASSVFPKQVESQSERYEREDEAGARVPAILSSLVPDVQRSVPMLLASFARAGYTEDNPLFPVLLTSAAALTRKELVAANLWNEGPAGDQGDIRYVLLDLAAGEKCLAPSHCLSASWNTSVYTSFLDFVIHHGLLKNASRLLSSPRHSSGCAPSPFRLVSVPSRLPAPVSETPHHSMGPSALFPPTASPRFPPHSLSPPSLPSSSRSGLSASSVSVSAESSETPGVPPSLDAVEAACVSVAASLGISPQVLEVWRFLGPLSTLPVQSALQRRVSVALHAVLDLEQVEMFEEVLLPPPLSAFVDLLLVHKASQRALAIEVDGPSHFLSWKRHMGVSVENREAAHELGECRNRRCEGVRPDRAGKRDQGTDNSGEEHSAEQRVTKKVEQRQGQREESRVLLSGSSCEDRLHNVGHTESVNDDGHAFAFDVPEWTTEEVYSGVQGDVVVPVRFTCDGKTRQKRLRLECAGVACLHVPFYRLPPWQSMASVAAFLRSTLPPHWLRKDLSLGLFKDPESEGTALQCADAPAEHRKHHLEPGEVGEDSPLWRKQGGKSFCSDSQVNPHFAGDREMERADAGVEAGQARRAGAELEGDAWRAVEDRGFSPSLGVEERRGRETHCSKAPLSTGQRTVRRPREAGILKGLATAPRYRFFSTFGNQRGGSVAAPQDDEATPIRGREKASECLPRPWWLCGEEKTRGSVTQRFGARDGDESDPGPRLTYFEDAEDGGESDGEESTGEPSEGHLVRDLTREQKAFLLQQAVRSFVSPMEGKRAKLASVSSEVSRIESDTAPLSTVAENNSALEDTTSQQPSASASLSLPEASQDSLVDASVLPRALGLQKKLESSVSRPHRLPVHVQWLHALATERQVHLERLGYSQPQLRLCMHRGNQERKSTSGSVLQDSEPPKSCPGAQQTEQRDVAEKLGELDESPRDVTFDTAARRSAFGDKRESSRPVGDSSSDGSSEASWALSPSFLLLTHQPMIYAVLSLTDPRLWFLAACPPNQAPAFHFLHLLDSASEPAAFSRSASPSKGKPSPARQRKSPAGVPGGAPHFVPDGRLAGVLAGQTLHAGRFGHRRVSEILVRWKKQTLDSAEQNFLLYPLEVLPCHHRRAPFQPIAEDRLRVWQQLLTQVQCEDGHAQTRDNFPSAAKRAEVAEQLNSQEKSLRARLLLPPPRQPQVWELEDEEGRTSPSVETERVSL
ncbi:UNVERIFIED_CONTAM: hypothetical protein HHA_220132 [Hammondia hammondi]|eukprot:XP_008887936.1 hypothetical protein HHA_220132 [Hammondia hammondi]